MDLLFLIVPKLGLKRLPDDKLDGYVQDKLDALKGNPHFPLTVPVVGDVDAALQDYRSKLARAKGGSRQDTVAKNASRRTLQELTTLLSYDVARRSNGDTVKYVTTHFQYRQSGGKLPPLDVPQNFRLLFTAYEGELKAACHTVKHANTYEFRLTLDPNKPIKAWEYVITTTRSKVLFIGLENGKRYYGMVRATGARGKISDWSDCANKICP